jgi:pimeloyl-ACP methyl ester carboxylesterase
MQRGFRRFLSAAVAQAEEMLIEVPWGHISAQAFGPKNGRPVLAIHGWLDNSTSFLGLQPYLPSDTRLVAIDLPGHGFSSHRPPGTKYAFYDWVRSFVGVLHAVC